MLKNAQIKYFPCILLLGTKKENNSGMAWIFNSVRICSGKIWKACLAAFYVWSSYVTSVTDIWFCQNYEKLSFIKKDPTRCNKVSNFIIPYLCEAQYVSGDTPSIIRSLKLHWQPLVFHTWKVVLCVVGVRCQAHCAWQRPPTTRTNNLPRMKNQRLPVQF